MPIEFDPTKSARNVAMGRPPFGVVEHFIWSECVIGVGKDQRYDTATRFFAIGEIDGKLHTVFFNIGEAGIRVFGLRRSDKRERKTWLASQP